MNYDVFYSIYFLVAFVIYSITLARKLKDPWGNLIDFSFLILGIIFLTLNILNIVKG